MYFEFELRMKILTVSFHSRRFGQKHRKREINKEYFEISKTIYSIEHGIIASKSR